MNNFYKSEKEIIAWLDDYQIKDYILIPDDKYGFVINVGGNVELGGHNLDFIPVKFSEVALDFSCADNKLSSLEFCPNKIGNCFYCHVNKLTSLEFCPVFVGGRFGCSYNNLISLKFCPKYVNGSFDCSNNKLISLEYCPKIVGGYFFCHNNQLESLEFCPQEVLGYFYCDLNPKLGKIQKITDFKEIYSLHKFF